MLQIHMLIMGFRWENSLLHILSHERFQNFHKGRALGSNHMIAGVGGGVSKLIVTIH